MSSSPDPVTALRDAWQHARQSLSFTSVRGWQETSTHHIHIGGYSTVSTLYKHGNGVESKTFRAGGHRWKVKYYPNGSPDSKTGSPSVGLKLLPSALDLAKATAGYTVSVLDHDGNLLCNRCVQPKDYKSGKKSIDSVDVQEKDAMAALMNHLKDDSLVVRCHITVHRSEKESRLRWLLRRFLD